MKIPTTGRTREEILELLGSYKKQDINWQSGRAFGYIYDPGKEINEFAKQVYMGCFLLPYFRRLGEPVADFDFSLPGVCSV